MGCARKGRGFLMADVEAWVISTARRPPQCCADSRIAARSRRLRTLCLEALALLPLLTGFTVYDDLAAWQAAVGTHQIEDFESFPEMSLPIDGGTIDLDRFLVE